jgi:hypothetical protein
MIQLVPILTPQNLSVLQNDLRRTHVNPKGQIDYFLDLLIAKINSSRRIVFDFK